MDHTRGTIRDSYRSTKLNLSWISALLAAKQDHSGGLEWSSPAGRKGITLGFKATTQTLISSCAHV
jgi:hypothetical protein